MSAHEHNFQYMGLVYAYDEKPLSGSGAHARFYEDKFFCTACLEIRYQGKRYQGNSYSPVIEGSSPKESQWSR